MFDLVAGMEFGIVKGMSLPHLPKDFEPALSKAAQDTSVALAALA